MGDATLKTISFAAERYLETRQAENGAIGESRRKDEAVY
jgi:hypothetical protein